HDLRHPVGWHRSVGGRGDGVHDHAFCRFAWYRLESLRHDGGGARAGRRVRRGPGLPDPALPARPVHRDAGGHVHGARLQLSHQHRVRADLRPHLCRHRTGAHPRGFRCLAHARRAGRDRHGAGRHAPCACHRVRPRRVRPRRRRELGAPHGPGGRPHAHRGLSTQRIHGGAGRHRHDLLHVVRLQPARRRTRARRHRRGGHRRDPAGGRRGLRGGNVVWRADSRHHPDPHRVRRDPELMVDENRRRSFAVALLPVAAAVRKSFAQDSMKRPFGRTVDGKEVEVFTLGSEPGLQAEILTLGGTLRSLTLPVGGRRIPLVLSFPDLSGYLKDTSYIGQLVGRYGNRIGGAAFELDGKRYELSKNNGPNTLHGGEVGFGKYVWTVLGSGKGKTSFVKLGHRSPAGINGFPGNLDVSAQISVHDNTLTLAYEATTDAPTPINLTWHPYFTPSGDPERPVDDLL